MPSITNFEGGKQFLKIERGDDIEIWVDPHAQTESTKEKMFIPSGIERVVRNGDPLFFESGLKCSVVDVLESHFTVWAKEAGIVYQNSSIMIPEKHSKLPIIREDDI